MDLRRAYARPRLTVQPTPKTWGLRSPGLSGAHMRSRTRAHEGGRKSYGTTCHTLPCQERSAAGFENSRPRALICMATAINRASRCNGDFLFRRGEAAHVSRHEASVRLATARPQSPECQSGEADPTERPLILRGVISMNRLRTPSAQGTGPVSQADVSR
jgi:hypothetical protein